MELTLMRASGQKRKCNVPGCKNTSTYVIVGIAPPFPICERCLEKIKRAILVGFSEKTKPGELEKIAIEKSTKPDVVETKKEKKTRSKTK